MDPTPSRPVSPPLPPILPLMDNRWLRRHSDRWPTYFIFPKHVFNEKMWYEWCEHKVCRNLEYEETVMDFNRYITFLNCVSKEYHINLIAKVPYEKKDLIPLRYMKKIRYLHYENYARLFGYAWGGGHYSEIPECFLAKIRMTFRQPAANLAKWVKKPFLYLITDEVNTNHANGLSSSTVLGKRKTKD